MSCIDSATDEEIRKKFTVVDVFSLDQLLAEPVSSLFKILKKSWKKEFAENERLVFTHVGDMPQQAVDHFQRILTHVDITNCFILLVTNDQNINTKLKLAQNHWTHDDTNINTWLTDFETTVGVQYDVSKFILPTTMCVNPWARLEIKPDGFIKPCCVYSTDLTDESGHEFNITTHSIKEIYFSKELTDLREQFLRGERPAKCFTCWNNENAGVTSIRQHSQWELNSDIYNIDWQSPTQDNLKSIALALGNVCNLKCRICNPESSSSIAAEQIKQIPLQDRKSSQLYALQKDKSWVKQDLNFWDEYYSLAPSLSEMRFTGGEPMMINKHFDLVKSIANSGESKHIILRYTTNGTIFPEHIVDHWQQYQQVEVSFSLDDIGSRLEYQRYGVIWETLKENIVQYQRLKNQMNLVTKVNCTVSIMNILYLPEICEWFDKIDIDHVRLNLLYFPQELTVLNMPMAVKNHVVSMLSNATFSNNVDDQVKSIVNAIRLSKHNNDPEQFTRKIKQVDQLRNQKFSDSHPEMAQLMNYNA